MSKNILDIYEEYKIMSVLSRHMLRVAAVASMICDNLTEPVNKKDIVTACLFHDMGNIIKFDLNYFPEFNKPEGLEYWQNVQNEYFEKYGENEHKATLKIMKEFGLSHEVIEIVENMHFLQLYDYRDGDNINTKIMNYADNRVNPHGVVSYDERLDEARIRYQNRKDAVPDEERQKLVACGKDIEKQIFAKCKIRPEDINDETVKSIIESLKNFVIC
jgi:putative nucleotidyltransferase with HDIG domain